MNKDIMKGRWKEIEGQLKNQWGKLTDDDITQINGSQEELEGRLQKIYGYQKDQVKKEINDFFKHKGWNE